MSGRRIIADYNSGLKPAIYGLFLATFAFVLSGCSAQRSQTPRAFTAQEAHGQRIFAGACSVCHRADSTDPLNGPGLKGIFKKPYLPSGLKATEQQVRETILHGRKNMPPMGALMNDQQLNDVVAYLKTL